LVLPKAISAKKNHPARLLPTLSGSLDHLLPASLRKIGIATTCQPGMDMLIQLNRIPKASIIFIKVI
jgi:hypothetical protein